MAPIVTGEVNPAALEDLVRLCVQLHELRHGTPDGDGTDDAADAGDLVRLNVLALERSLHGARAD